MREEIQEGLPRSWPRVQERSPGRNQQLFSFRREGVRGAVVEPRKQSVPGKDPGLWSHRRQAASKLNLSLPICAVGLVIILPTSLAHRRFSTNVTFHPPPPHRKMGRRRATELSGGESALSRWRGLRKEVGVLH